jgi:two-component system chemotaxis response regulator CheY
VQILVVEDDLITRKLIQRLLVEVGDCEFAVDGLDGLQKFEKAHSGGIPFDVILLDVMLPQMDGLTLLKKIRTIEDNKSNDSFHSKIIIMTAKGGNEVEKQANKYGCDAFLGKPISGKKLISIINKLVNNV